MIKLCFVLKLGQKHLKKGTLLTFLTLFEYIFTQNQKSKKVRYTTGQNKKNCIWIEIYQNLNYL